MFVIRLPSSSGQKKGSEVTSGEAAPSTVADGTRTTEVGSPVVELILDVMPVKVLFARLRSTTGLEEVAPVKVGAKVAFCVSTNVVVTVYNRVLRKVEMSRS